ncbi:hypothetical protein QQS21_008579 [Conoideocrella luteorostrata]|uniref:ABC transporter n=1 Tax=Conoideocrella luteorostrata TaxID=1105319 RepID=A0AAJ0FVV9_9HYPO|nr:hypothetical protein QQS21_008579 [Conoideocrella luteorostrata]
MEVDNYNATACGDGVFGPGVWTSGCRGGFDFSLTFQESILTILPAAVFLALAGPRVVYLFRSRDRTRKTATYTPKLVMASVLSGLNVGLVAIVAASKRLNTNVSLASSVLSLVASCCILLLAHAEHVKSIRPSFLLTIYLFVSLLFDATRLRTEWLLSINNAYASVLSAVVGAKLTLLVLETVEKRSILIKNGKSPSKESTSGPLSRGFFVWLNPLLITGWATILTNKGLPDIYEKLSSRKLEVRFATKWDKKVAASKTPWLFLTTLNVLKWELASITLPRVGMIGLSISQPFLISNALRFLAMPDSPAATNLGYGLIGAFALVFLGSALLTAWHEHLTFRAGAMVRGGLISLIYRKTLRMPTKDLLSSSAVALMGNDVETLTERLSNLLVESWANTVTVGIAMWLLYVQLGAVFVAPIVMALVSLSVNTWLGKLMVPRMMTYQKATQDRINFTSEVLGNMRAVKMLGFTDKFSRLISQKRNNDIDAGKQFRVISVWTNAVTNGNISITQAVTFGAYAIAAKITGSDTFSTTQAITALSILNVMMMPLSHLLGNIPSSFSAFGCFKRIQDFLLLDERVDGRTLLMRPHEKILDSTSHDGHVAAAVSGIELGNLKPQKMDVSPVTVSSGSFNWGERAVLQDINTSLPMGANGSLTTIVGPIGSGKSTFLKALLGETAVANGVVSLSSAEVSFCDQTPWVMNATIKDNIIAESRGFEESWFDTVVEACDLAVDLARLPAGAETVVGDKGLRLSGGQKQRIAIARAVYSRKRVAIFDDVFSGLDKVTERAVFTRLFSKTGLLRQSGTTVILATHSVHHLPESDFVIALDAAGHIVEQGTFTDLRTRGKYIQSLDITEPDTESDEEESTSRTEVKEMTDEVKPLTMRAEVEQKRSSDRATFKYYLASVRWFNLIVSASYVILQGVLIMMRYVWITWWGDGKFRPSDDVGFWLGLYTAMSMGETVFISLAIMEGLMVLGPVSGRLLHSRLLNAVMGAPLSFITKNETGSLVNRFSQDLRFVDVVLPITLSVFLFEVVNVISIAGLAAAAVSWFAISIPFVVVVLVVIQRFYVRTSKQLRLLEIEHKAPLYSHFLESMNGLSTIRAFGWTKPYCEKNLRLLDNAQKPSYLLYCIQRWLTLVLDLVVAALTVMLMACAVVLRHKVNPSLLGIALVNMMELGNNLKGIIIQWSTLETSLGAVTRIKEFAENAPVEVLPQESKDPGLAWPAQGAVQFRKVSVKYDTLEEPILQNITFDIQHGQRIGICGRSGSGKSSLIQTLFRLADIIDGQVLIDGEDITRIPRSLVRERLSCLTQEPFIFTNTIRFNVDPLEQHEDDAKIVDALRRVGLWSIMKRKIDDGKNPLYETMDETFLSHGQRQLLCLARALLKKSSVLILDEPTSSVDRVTDATMQEVIRAEFRDQTIIMIAHRLDTLLDFDKIAVLDMGVLVEFDSPERLLANGDGYFSRLYRADGTKR